MDARSAMRPCYILPMFFLFYIFFMAASVGQTAERIFTKLSHVVDMRCYLRTYRINLFLALLKLHGGTKNDEILHIF